MIAQLLALLAMTACITAAPKRHTVIIQQFQFKPPVIHAHVGDTIVWANRDMVPHTAEAAGKSWDSGNIPAGARRTIVVQKRGEQQFSCLYHANMKGKLIVN